MQWKKHEGHGNIYYIDDNCCCCNLLGVHAFIYSLDFIDELPCAKGCQVIDEMVNKRGPCLQAACNILSIKEKFSNAFEEQKFDLHFLQRFT